MLCLILDCDKLKLHQLVSLRDLARSFNTIYNEVISNVYIIKILIKVGITIVAYVFLNLFAENLILCVLGIYSSPYLFIVKYFLHSGYSVWREKLIYI